MNSPLTRTVGLALVAVAAASASGGCARFARQPDTPAARVYYTELENPPAPAGERYFVMVFGAQTVPKIPRYTHTWMTLLRVPAPEPGKAPVIEHHSISWMPATLEIRPWRLKVEPGVNLTMRQSIEMAQGHCERVSLWGPFEISIGLYRKLMIQKEFVDHGTFGYQCIDTVGEAARLGNGSNCIHAISDADALFTRQAYPLSFFGDSAGRNIVRQLVERGAIPDPYTTHDFLLPELGLDQASIVRRPYEPPLCPELFSLRMMRGQLRNAEKAGKP